MLAFLLVGFLSQEHGLRFASSQSVKQSEIDDCLDETESLYGSSFALTRQVNDLLHWTETQRSTPEAVCTRKENKRTCVLDYVNATGNESSDWCLSIPATLYVETDYILRCTNTEDRQMIFYSILNRPACYSNFPQTDSDTDITSSACYNGYDNKIIESIELGTFDELKSDLLFPNGNNDREWGFIADGFVNCDQLRFIVTEPQMAVVGDNEGIILNCSEATSQIQTSPEIADAVARIEEKLGVAIPNKDNVQMETERSNRLLMPLPFDGSIIDYSEVSHNISAVCEQTMNGIYLEISYDVVCGNSLQTAEAGEDGLDNGAVEFRINYDPLCLSNIFCATTDFEYEAISHAASKWNSDSGSMYCKIVTASSSDDEDEYALNSNATTILEQKPAVVWEDFSPSQNPTETPSPTASIAPSMRPTASANPTSSTAPSQNPTVVSCFDESLNLLQVASDQDEIEDETEAKRLRMATELVRVQSLLTTSEDFNGEGIEKYCSSSSERENDVEAITTTIDALCEFNYEDIIESTETEDSIASLCLDSNTLYVEDSVAITCGSVDERNPLSGTTKVMVRNKPSCRSKKCNADGVREVAIAEVQRWIKRTLEKGNADTSSSILAGRQSCVIDANDEDLKGGILVTLGVSDDDGPIEPTDQCLKDSGFLKSQIEIYNQNRIADQQFIEYLDTDLRQICGSPTPGVLVCNFDWSDLFPSTDEGTRLNCMVDKNSNSTTGCGGGGGQYVESSFRMDCTGREGELTINSRNVPDCIGKPCSPGQAQNLLKDRYLSFSNTFMDEFKRFDWTSCETEVLSVHASHFDPFYGTHDLECYKNLQFEEIVAEEIVEDEPVDIWANDISDLNSDSSDANGNSPASSDLTSDSNTDSNGNYNIMSIEREAPTEAPTEAPPTLIGPRYGILFDPPPTMAPDSSATARTITVAATMTILSCEIFFSGFI